MALIGFFDTETTGLKAANDRIIEIAIAGFDLHSKKLVFEMAKRINPCGATIDPKAQLVHGIRQSDLIGAPRFADVEPIISKIFSKLDIAVAHNISFDIDFLFSEYSRLGKKIPDVRGFCTMENARWATSNGKLPNLGELCYACNVDYDPAQAHQALYDIRKTSECFFYGSDHGGYDISELLKS